MLWILVLVGASVLIAITEIVVRFIDVSDVPQGELAGAPEQFRTFD